MAEGVAGGRCKARLEKVDRYLQPCLRWGCSDKPTNQRRKTMQFNGWTNKETWLVNVWYMDSMPEFFADMDQFHVEPDELEETVQSIVEECEALSQLPAGLLSDFINDSWLEVNWHELADALNETLKDMETP